MKRRAIIAAIPAAVATLAGCGGGGGFDTAGIGSGGTGITGGEGVGSGGTGITSAAVGSITGFGSVIVNGVKFETDRTTLDLNDVAMLKLGMTVHVRGVVGDDLLTGVANSIYSAADARGAVEAIDLPMRKLIVWSTPIYTDSSTVFAGGLSSLEDVRLGDPVQIHGLPGVGTGMRATRVEKIASVGLPIISGMARNLDASAQTLQVGGIRIGFLASLLQAAGLSLGQLEGQLLRVRGTTPDTLLAGTTLEAWYPLAPNDGERLALEGLITRFDSLGSMQVDGVPVDASGAQVSGRAASVGLGARVEVVGSWRAGVLVVSRLKLRAAAPSFDPGRNGNGNDGRDDDANDYSASGNIGAFRSPSSFKIQGTDIDAGGSDVQFVGGTAADLRNGRRVKVSGTRVVDDVLVAERVEFL